MIQPGSELVPRFFQTYRDASQRYVALRVTKHFGIKVEPCTDGCRRFGLYFLLWYGRKRLTYRSAWLPLWKTA